MDNTYTVCYFPFYCGIDACRHPLPGDRSSILVGFGLVGLQPRRQLRQFPSTLTCRRCLSPGDIEGNFLALQPAVEKTALELLQTNPTWRRYPYRLLVMHGELTYRRWRTGRAPHHEVQRRLRPRRGLKYPDAGYSEAWLCGE